MVFSKQILLILSVGSVCAIDDLNDGSCGDDDVALLQTKLTPVLQQKPISANSAEPPKTSLVADSKTAKRKERRRQRKVSQKPADTVLSSDEWDAFCAELSNCASEDAAVFGDDGILDFAVDCACAADADSPGMTMYYYGFASVETFKKGACGCPDSNSGSAGVESGAGSDGGLDASDGVVDGGDGGVSSVDGGDGSVDGGDGGVDGGDGSVDASVDGGDGSVDGGDGSVDGGDGSVDGGDGSVDAGDGMVDGSIDSGAGTSSGKDDYFDDDSAPDMTPDEWEAFCVELAACTTNPLGYACNCEGTADEFPLSFNYYGFHAKVDTTKAECGCAR